MNCSVCSKAIPVYRELSKIEQNNIDHHIMQCTACKKLFNQHILFDDLIRKASIAKPEYAHPEFAKQQIIKGIAQVAAPVRNHSWLISESLNFAWARFALFSLSVFLVFTFLMEVNYEPFTTYSQPTQTNSIIINYKNIRNSFTKRDHEKSLLLTPQCIASLGRKDINCLKSKLKTYTYDTQ